MDLLLLFLIMIGVFLFARLVTLIATPPVEPLDNVLDNRPCPPAPHKWKWGMEQNSYGEEVEIIRCQKCKKKPGEIE